MIKWTSRIAVFLALFVFIGSNNLVHAADFNKNRIIDDSIFTDTDSMSVSQIQAFLESQGSLLANWVDNVDMKKSDGCIVHKATNMTAAEIIAEAANGWGAQRVNNCAGTSVEYWDDISGYQLQTISPKALLVTLQKEQSLISATGTPSTNPNAYVSPCNDSEVNSSYGGSWSSCVNNDKEYKIAWATGYAVPDTGSVNHKYKGFYNQINWAAWQLRFNYERSAGNTSWDGVGYITYSGPMTAGTRKRCDTCTAQSFDGYYPIDGSPLYMSNRATAALYYYTPHTYPGYYGNYNFVQFFTEWFGSVFANEYVYSFVSQNASSSMVQGFGNTYTVRLKNDGTKDWYDQTGLSGAPEGTLPTRIATAGPVNRSSAFSNGWPSNNRPVTDFTTVYSTNGTSLAANQHKVMPGQSAVFTFTLTAPETLAAKTYKEEFTLVRDGGGGDTMKGPEFWPNMQVIAANYSSKYIGQSTDPVTLLSDTSAASYIKIQNTGNVNWYDPTTAVSGLLKPTRLGTAEPINRNSKFSDTWPLRNRATQNFGAVYEKNGTTLAANQHMAVPGQIVRFDFNINPLAGTTPGSYREYFRLIRDGAPKYAVFGPNMWMNVNYNGGTYKAGYVSQSANPTIAKGTTQSIYIRLKNTGTAPWYSTSGTPSGYFPVVLSTSKPINRASVFGTTWNSNKNRPTPTYAAVYESDNSTLASNQQRVLPGQIVRLKVDLKVPSSQASGKYREYFQIIRDGAPSWQFTTSPTFWIDIRVP